MKRLVTALVAALMALGSVSSPTALAQSSDDFEALSKCVGYEACKAIQDRIDAIRRGAGTVVNSVANAVSPNDNRSYFVKFTLEERQEAMAACEKNYAGRNCETSYLTAEEIAARHPQAKAPPPPSPDVARAREREQLGGFDKSIADVLDLKCFAPALANGQFYGDCADALTRLNRLEQDAKALGLPLRSSALAAQYGFPRNPDGTWNDRYARVGEAQKLASAPTEASAAPAASNATQADANYAALMAKCPQIRGCAVADLEAIVQGSDALRQEACGGPNCSEGNLKLMSQVEKELLAKGNRARSELASRSARPAPQASASTGGFGHGLLGAPIGRFGQDPQPAAASYSAPPASVAASGNDVWEGQTSGNRVRIEFRSDGLVMYTVTENAGQGASGMVFASSGSGRYVKSFPDGTQAVVTTLQSGLLHMVGPDGWADDFKRVGP